VRTQNRVFSTTQATPVDANWIRLDNDIWRNLKSSESVSHRYINDKNGHLVVLVRFEKPQGQYLEEKRKLRAIRKEARKIKLVEIDCSNLTEHINKAYEIDEYDAAGNWAPNSEYEIKQIIMSVFENCGFPSKKIHGDSTILKTFFIVQHSDKSTRKKYLPLFKASSENGELEKKYLALLIDRVLQDNGDEQLYGSQISIDKNGIRFVKTIQDIKNLDKRRAEMGLEKMQDYLDNWGLDFNKILKEHNGS
tara:strand:- start:112 stop:861 length:750 start_codon:yes stop_codon:yes gene_type:complete